MKVDDFPNRKQPSISIYSSFICVFICVYPRVFLENSALLRPILDTLHFLLVCLIYRRFLEQIEHLNYRSSYENPIGFPSSISYITSYHIPLCHIIHILIMHKLIEIAGKSVNHPLNPGLKFQTNKFNKTKGNWFLSISITSYIKHGSLNVPIEHHPTMNGIWSIIMATFSGDVQYSQNGAVTIFNGKIHYFYGHFQ